MTAPDITAAIRRIWEQNRGITAERVQCLVEALAALEDGGCSKELRDRAEQNAHKIAGSAGSFGYQEISELARQLELLFAATDAPLTADRVREQIRELRTRIEQT